MTTERDIAKSQAQLDMIEPALKEYEVAKFLIDTQGIEAVSEALRRVEAREAELGEDYDTQRPLNPTLKPGFRSEAQRA